MDDDTLFWDLFEGEPRAKNGYVERIQNQTDKRKYELTITEKAKQIIPDIKKEISRTSALAFEGITEIQIEELYKMFSILEINLL